MKEFWDCVKDGGSFVNSFHGWWGFCGFLIAGLLLKAPGVNHTEGWIKIGMKLSAFLPVLVLALFIGYTLFYAPFAKLVAANKKIKDLEKDLSQKSNSAIYLELEQMKEKQAREDELKKQNRHLNIEDREAIAIRLKGIPIFGIETISFKEDAETGSVADSYEGVLINCGFQVHKTQETYRGNYGEGVAIYSNGEDKFKPTVEAIATILREYAGVEVKIVADPKMRRLEFVHARRETTDIRIVVGPKS